METDTGSTDSRKNLVDMKAVSLCIAGRILIQDFTLRLDRGVRVGLTGPSGCGKTTLIRSIVGRQLTPGSVADRFELTRCRVGYVPQRGGMLPWYSVRRNLQVFAASATDDKESWCQNVLARMELTYVEATFPWQLSGGEFQRARLACAIASQPGLCCADEPLTEVGLQQKWRLLERWSSEMHDRETSLILVSHDVDTLMYLCDEIVILGGPTGQPARTITRLNLSAETHPRDPAGLNSSSFEDIRRMLVKTLYLGVTAE